MTLLSMRTVCVAVLMLSALTPVSARSACLPDWPPTISGVPYAFAAPQMGVVVYVESDGKHVAAMRHDGRILWVTDVAKAASKFRVPPPSTPGWNPSESEEFSRFDRIGLMPQCQIDLRLRNRFPKGHHGIWIGFGTHALGVLDAATGDFIIGEIN